MAKDNKHEPRIAKVGCKAGSVYMIVTDPTQHLQSNWVRGRFYERQMLRYIWTHHRYPEGIYVDIGASVGNHTIFFAAFCTENMVLAVEPVKQSLELLRANAALNHLSHRITAAPFALSDHIGKGKMERFGGPRYDGMQRLVEGDEVHITTLDTLVKTLRSAKSLLRGTIRVIKIDAEYSEDLILPGALEVIKADLPVVFVECVDGDKLKTVHRFFADLDYESTARFNASATYLFEPKEKSR